MKKFILFLSVEKKKLLAGLVIGLLLVGRVGIAEATMLSPTSIINNTLGELSGYPVINLINHTGLSNDFVSGVTDLSTYIGGDTGHSSPSLPGVGFASGDGTSSGIIDFDLGNSYILSTFLLWNDNDYQAINNFELFVDDEASFTNAISLGSFSASYGPADNSLGVLMQQFSLQTAEGRYVRLQIYDAHYSPSSIVNFGEIAFDGTPVGDSVPEPATMLLLGTGFIGLVGFRKKFKK